MRILAAALTALLLAATPATAADRAGLPWFVDDADAAIAKAAAEGKPLLVDLWAPWCHTCLSMKHEVFPQREILELRDRFVWLALDTDKEVNAKALETFRPEVWPTFYVASADGTIHARHGGALSVEGLRELLGRGEALARDSTSLTDDQPAYWVREGDRQQAAKDYAAALRAYDKALSLAPPSWPNAPQVLVSVLRSQYRQEAFIPCAKRAIADMGRAVRGVDASAGDFALYAHLCASKAGDPPLAKAVYQAITARRDSLAWALKQKGSPMSADDRSDALSTLRQAWLGLGNKAKATEAAARQVQVIDEALSRARTPKEEMGWGWPKAEVYVWLGRGAEVVPWLQSLTARLPAAYDPPYRLAWVLSELGRSAEALPHAQRAFDLSYGPRKERTAALLDTIKKAVAARAAD